METFLFLFEMLGTIAFAASGAVLGVRKGLDVFGVCFLGLTTACGGGMVRDVLLPKMEALRKPCDEAEQRTAVGCWPFPTYGDLLFGVQ